MRDVVTFNYTPCEAGVFNGTIVAYSYYMNFRMIHILFLALTLTFGICISSPASENIPSQHELDLLSLINEARENPLAMASSLGMDTDQILKDLPELNDILIEGLPSLTFNENLYAAASAHTRDMLDNNYYSHTSLDGRTCDDRIIETGYILVATGESLGMLAFNNFIEPAQAVKDLFENMFVDELDPLRTEKRNILDPELREAGVSVLPGTFNLDGSLWNVYLTTCDFASPDMHLIEMALLEMINKARNDPYQALEMAGVDEGSAREALGDYAWVLDQGLPPLAWNEQLHEAALGHNLDMIEHAYFSEVSLEGEGPSERVAATGYEALYVGETLGTLDSEHFVDSIEIACLIYENMVKDEFNSASTVQKNIFNPDVTEVGIGFEKVVVDPDDWDSLITYMVVADFALPVESRTFLVGNVYYDLDGDENFDPWEWEGIAGLKISLKHLFGPGVSETTIHSGPLGSYQLELHPFVFYELLIEGDDGNIIHTEFHGSQNRNELNNILIGDNPKGTEELRN